MSNVNVSDLMLRYLTIAARAANGNERSRMALEIIHGTMDEKITNEQARAVSGAWKLGGVKAAHALYQAFVEQAEAGEENLEHDYAAQPSS